MATASNNKPTLPTEVVLEVVEYCLQVFSDEHLWLVLSRVSKLFRDVVEQHMVNRLRRWRVRGRQFPDNAHCSKIYFHFAGLDPSDKYIALYQSYGAPDQTIGVQTHLAKHPPTFSTSGAAATATATAAVVSEAQHESSYGNDANPRRCHNYGRQDPKAPTLQALQFWRRRHSYGPWRWIDVGAPVWVAIEPPERLPQLPCPNQPESGSGNGNGNGNQPGDGNEVRSEVRSSGAGGTGTSTSTSMDTMVVGCDWRRAMTVMCAHYHYRKMNQAATTPTSLDAASTLGS